MAEIEMSNKVLHQIAYTNGMQREFNVNGVNRVGWVYSGVFYYRVGTMFFRVRYE